MVMRIKKDVVFPVSSKYAPGVTAYVANSWANRWRLNSYNYVDACMPVIVHSVNKHTIECYCENGSRKWFFSRKNVRLKPF